MRTKKEEFKLASELTLADLGKRIYGYHGARGAVRDRPARTYNTIDSITFSSLNYVTVTVLKSKYEKRDTVYSASERVKLIYWA
jgi:hypothetical protein